MNDLTTILKEFTNLLALICGTLAIANGYLSKIENKLNEKLNKKAKG